MKLVGGLVLLALGWFAGCNSSAIRADAASLESIARLEDRRTIGPSGELLAFLAHHDAALRVRAASAVGRLKFPVGGEQTTLQLRALLRDPEPSVRACAAFALGMREDPSAYEELVGLGTGGGKDASAAVRARALEAASKLNRLELAEQFLTGLDDSSAEVRLETAAGSARWKADAAGASEVNTRVAAFVASELDLRARTYGLFALERRKAKEGREVFLKSARAPDVDERLFAVRGLANLAGAPAIDEALGRAVRDADWRIAVEALRGLAQGKSAGTLEAVAQALGSDNFHVRAAALEAVTALDDLIAATILNDTRHLESFKRLAVDESAAVRTAAVANPMLRLSLELRAGAQPDISPHVRAAAERARTQAVHSYRLGALSGRSPLLAPEERETTLLVRGARIEALAKLSDQASTAELLARLCERDNGLRLAAVSALLERKWSTLDIAALARCYDTATGEIATELRFNLLKLAARAGGDDARKLLARGLEDPDAFVRRTAHDELGRLSGTSVAWTDSALPGVELGVCGEGLLANPRPRILIVSSRGEMEFVLLADEAPQHVLNFLKHIDFYKGTTFHRIVSDFVAQGGDARGDGNGGSSWRGDALRHEITPRKYARGSLGMPRNEDWDSGGSQIFVTHRPTPHLDGRYTIFGELVKGFEVLDALDLGDAILEVRVLR